MKVLTISGSVLLCMLIIAGVIKPVPVPAEEECLIARGVVIKIEEAGTRDVLFTLRQWDKQFYINRGLEHDVTIEDLRKKLLLQEILIKYPSYWTPFGNSVKHISKLEFRDEIIYTELDR